MITFSNKVSYSLVIRHLISYKFIAVKEAYTTKSMYLLHKEYNSSIQQRSAPFKINIILSKNKK